MSNATEERAPDPVGQAVHHLCRIQTAAGDMIAAIGRNEPITSAALLRLVGALEDANTAIDTYQALALSKHRPGPLAEVVPMPADHVVTTVSLDEVPVDGSVEVRGVTTGGRYGPWGHVIGEQQAVGGQGYRSLLIDGMVEPWTWHRDAHVQVRPFRPVDDDLADAVHRSRNGGL